MVRITGCFLFFSLLCAWIANSQPLEDDYSRQDIFFTLETLEQKALPFALPPSFKFPSSARTGSVFGIDVSHHTASQCNCDLAWDEISSQKVKFAYLKATQGIRFSDPLFKSYRESIKLQKKRIAMGSYHFMTSQDNPQQQALHYLDFVQKIDNSELPPTLDLEWNPGPMAPECPQNATIPVRTKNGSIIEKCDLWYKHTGDEILSMVNAWINVVRINTGRQPMVYTNAYWWSSRIGHADKISKLGTDLIWIADYSRDGLATEKPRVPNNHPWYLWQFTDRALIKSENKHILVDASIISEDLFSQFKQLGQD